MKVAVVGAGAGGLTAAHRLSKAGHECDVYELWPALGGQAATLELGAGRRLERFGQESLGCDTELVALFDELGLPGELEWLPSSVAVFGASRLGPLTRLRTALALRPFTSDWEPDERLERLTAQDWIERRIGAQAWSKLWAPLLGSIFGAAADEVSMAWLTRALARARATPRGCPRGSLEVLWARLAELIEEHGGRVMLDRPVARIARDADGFALTIAAPGSFRAALDPRTYGTLPEPRRYDAVVAAVPGDVFAALLDEGPRDALSHDYRERLRTTDYRAAVCLLLELDQRLTSHHRTYVADQSLPFSLIAEHTNFVEPERYGGARYVHVTAYVAPDDALLELDADALQRHFEPGLVQLNPAFTPAWVRRCWASRERHARPIVRPGCGQRMPAIETGVPGLLLINSAQAHPADVGTGATVALAEHAAAQLGRELATR